MTTSGTNDTTLDDAMAMDLYQFHLDASTRLVLEGKTQAYCAHVALPYIFHTGAGEEIVETQDDLAADIQQITDWLHATSATDYHRIARQARFRGPDLIEGYHVTYALRGAIPIVAPYANRMFLRQVDGKWLASYSEHELAVPLYANRAVKSAPGLFAGDWSRENGAATRSQIDALPLYQGLIDAMSDAVNARDFDTWVACFQMPHHIHYNAVDHVVRVPSDVRPFHDTICAEMDKCAADGIVRAADFASFVSNERLLGYHNTTMIKDGDVCFGPIKSRMIFVQTDAGWKCSSITNSLSNTGFPGGAFQPSCLLPTMREIQERMRK